MEPKHLEANPIFDHSPELVGSYTLNKNRKSYGEFFDEKSAINLVDPSRRNTDEKRTEQTRVGDPLSPTKKKRLEELRRKARGE